MFGVSARTVLVLTHAPEETPGAIADALASRGIGTTTIRSFAGEAVPRDLGDALGLVVMGGPQGVYETDRHPFLRDELRLIGRTLADARPILGVCLGSQLLAAALGAEIRPGEHKEIGWAEVRLTDAALSDPLFTGHAPSFVAFHWHGDVFTLPRNAVSLARSDRTEHQAFRWGDSAYGILFHMEVTHSLVRAMVRAFGDEARTAGADTGQVLADADAHLPALENLGKRAFLAWVDMLRPEAVNART
jgi:GMP synthase (glutamine-hydrolysing)